MWLTKLKIAIVEKDTTSLDALLDNIPQLQDTKEIEETIYLLKEASELMYTLKDEAAYSMKQIKKNLQFLRSTDAPALNKLDIRS